MCYSKKERTRLNYKNLHLKGYVKVDTLIYILLFLCLLFFSLNIILLFQLKNLRKENLKEKILEQTPWVTETLPFISNVEEKDTIRKTNRKQAFLE